MPDRPWVAINSTGAIFIIYDNDDSYASGEVGTFLTSSVKNGTTFSSPSIVQQGAWPTGLVIGPDGTLFAAMLSLQAADP